MTVTLGTPVAVEPLELLLLPHSGDMARLFSADRGWSRSGERARRSSGDPGSALFGRDMARLAAGDTDNEAPGLNTCNKLLSIND